MTRSVWKNSLTRLRVSQWNKALKKSPRIGGLPETIVWLSAFFRAPLRRRPQGIGPYRAWSNYQFNRWFWFNDIHGNTTGSSSACFCARFSTVYKITLYKLLYGSLRCYFEYRLGYTDDVNQSICRWNTVLFESSNPEIRYYRCRWFYVILLQCENIKGRRFSTWL